MHRRTGSNAAVGVPGGATALNCLRMPVSVQMHAQRDAVSCRSFVTTWQPEDRRCFLSMLTCWSQELPPALSVQPEHTQALQVDPESLVLSSHVRDCDGPGVLVRIDAGSNAKTVD
jgi:hypothetical protein